MNEARKDYLRRLIDGVRDQMASDPETVTAKLINGDETITSRWIDAELLCSVIECEILTTTKG